MLEYKNYYGSIEFSSADRCFIGRIEFIEDLIIFDGRNVDDLEAAFRDAVDSHIAFCESKGRGAYKGSFRVRIGSALHRKAAVAAKKSGQSLNDFVKSAVERVVDEALQSHE